MSASGLGKKLGLKAGMAVLVLNEPAEFRALLGDLPPDGRFLSAGSAEKPDAVIAFVRTRAEIAEVAPRAIGALAGDKLLWFAYPKKTGSIKSDISRDSGWEPVFAAGYDSVAQVAIDADWTGFRFRLALPGQALNTSIFEVGWKRRRVIQIVAGETHPRGVRQITR